MDTVELIVECSIDYKQEETIKKFGEIKYCLPMINSYVIKIRKSDIKKLRGVNGVTSVCDSQLITAQMNETRKIVNAVTKEDFRDAYTGKGVTIAILDTGVAPVDDLCYPDNRIVAFKDFINNKDAPYDDNAHGTHVAY